MNRPRSNPEQPFTGFPALGAVHEILPTTRLRDFLHDFAVIADDVFEKAFLQEQDEPPLKIENLEGEQILGPIAVGDTEEEYDMAYNEYDSKKYFTVFNVERMGISVFEMQSASKAARATRSIWENHDLGAVEEDAKNEIYRHFPNHPPKFRFKTLASVGGRLPQAPKSDVRQKIALLPDPATYIETFDLLNMENEKIADAITKRMKQQFSAPSSFVPHLTFAAFRKKAQPAQISEIINATNEMLNPTAQKTDKDKKDAPKPIELTLGKLVFRRNLERRERP